MLIGILISTNQIREGAERPKGYGNVLGFPKNPQFPIKIGDFKVFFAWLGFFPKIAFFSLIAL